MDELNSFLHSSDDDILCVQATESVDSRHDDNLKYLLANTKEDILCVQAAENIKTKVPAKDLNEGAVPSRTANLSKHLANTDDDILCVQAAENIEKKIAIDDLNAGAGSSTTNGPEQEVIDPSFVNTFHTTKGKGNETEREKLSVEAKAQIQKALKSSSLANIYASELFFPLESWPAYMVEMFVLNNVAMYTYTMRNKICLFFWGNGATIDQLFSLSELFAPRVQMITHEQQQQFEGSRRKCEMLFETYNKEKMNPVFCSKYYYYNLMENRMLYMDGRARHFGQRQEDAELDKLPLWALR